MFNLFTRNKTVDKKSWFREENKHIKFVTPEHYYRDGEYADYDFKLIMETLYAYIHNNDLEFPEDLKEPLTRTSSVLFAYYQNIYHPLDELFKDDGGFVRSVALRTNRVPRYISKTFDEFKVSCKKEQLRLLIGIHIIALLSDSHLMSGFMMVKGYSDKHKDKPKKYKTINTFKTTQTKKEFKCEYPFMDANLNAEIIYSGKYENIPAKRIHLLNKFVDQEIIEFIIGNKYENIQEIYTFLGKHVFELDGDSFYECFYTLIHQDIREVLKEENKLKDIKTVARANRDADKLNELADIERKNQKRIDERCQNALVLKVKEKPKIEVKNAIVDDISDKEIIVESKNENNLSDELLLNTDSKVIKADITPQVINEKYAVDAREINPQATKMFYLCLRFNKEIESNSFNKNEKNIILSASEDVIYIPFSFISKYCSEKEIVNVNSFISTIRDYFISKVYIRFISGKESIFYGLDASYCHKSINNLSIPKDDIISGCDKIVSGMRDADSQTLLNDEDDDERLEADDFQDKITEESAETSDLQI